MRAHKAPTGALDINPKVSGATLAGALAIVLVWILGAFDVDVPVEGGAAITTLLAATGGYLTPVTTGLGRLTGRLTGEPTGE